jgi:hypothetical protein
MKRQTPTPMDVFTVKKMGQVTSKSVRNALLLTMFANCAAIGFLIPTEEWFVGQDIVLIAISVLTAYVAVRSNIVGGYVWTSVKNFPLANSLIMGMAFWQVVLLTVSETDISLVIVFLYMLSMFMHMGIIRSTPENFMHRGALAWINMPESERLDSIEVKSLGKDVKGVVLPCNVVFGSEGKLFQVEVMDFDDGMVILDEVTESKCGYSNFSMVAANYENLDGDRSNLSTYSSRRDFTLWVLYNQILDSLEGSKQLEDARLNYALENF